MDAYDLFISYHWRDHSAVEKLARALRQRGLSVFLDRWYLAPGQAWQQRLEEVLGSAAAVAVCVGPEGLGSWQQRERQLALDRQATEPTFPVIPVLLPGADPPLGFLRLNTWVDLREGPDSRHLDLLAAAVRGVSPVELVVAESHGARASVCPYRGLLPFREEDSAFFRGRAAAVEELLETVRGRPLIALVGASGSGKSSVVRAGLVPALRSESSPTWDVVTLVPADRPSRALAEALLPLVEPMAVGVDRLTRLTQLAEGLRQGALTLADVVAEALRQQPGTERLLLVVDQWEELYTAGAAPEDRERFVELLLEGSARGPLTVVMTLRGDFYGRAIAQRNLADALRDAVVNLGPMTVAELRRAVQEPAELAGLSFEHGLVERILRDVGDEPGNLPLLEFLLEELWKARRGSTLHHDAYDALGGVQGALTTRAEDVYSRLPEPEQAVARRLLVQLVRPGEGSGDTRRRILLPTPEGAARDLLHRLVDARLLVSAHDAGAGGEMLEIAHEALIRSWRRLRDWVDADRELLRVRERVVAAARQWSTEGRPEDRLLSPGIALEEARALLQAQRSELETGAVEFIEASIRRERDRQRAAERSTRKRLRNRTWAVVVVTGLAAFALYGWDRASRANDALQAAYAELERSLDNTMGRIEAIQTQGSRAQEAGARSAQAESRAQRANEQLARELATLQIAQRRLLDALLDASGPTDPMVGVVVMALDAIPYDPDEPSVAFGPNVVRGLNQVLMHRIGAERRAGIATTPWLAASDPAGQRVVAALAGASAAVWERSSGDLIAVLEGHSGPVLAAAFDPAGERVVTASADGSARVWDAASGRTLLTLSTGRAGVVRSAAFDGTGERVVTVAADRTARVWDATSGRILVVLDGAAERS